MDGESAMPSEDFCLAGKEIHGEHWLSPLAKTLGSYHPDGARDHIDERTMRRWATGARPIPAWVPPALIDILDIKEIELRADADRKARVLAQLGFRRQTTGRSMADRED